MTKDKKNLKRETKKQERGGKLIVTVVN